MIAALEWKGEYRFDADVSSGGNFSFDNVDEGVVPAGPSPMEAFLTSLAACTAMDVISILKKKRQDVKSYRVEIEAERPPRGEWPRPFTSFRINHVIEGTVDTTALARAIELSEQKYCSVSATLRIHPIITNTFEIK
ncbi:MAG: OsmC family protein [Armatimonadota bacterium]|nr:OsmC family protein [Armatimonadota bacterium]